MPVILTKIWFKFVPSKLLLFCNVVSAGGGRSSYAPYYVGVSDWPATGISLPRLHSSDKGTIFQMPQSPFSGDHRQSSPSANKLLTPKMYENVPPSAIQKTNILRKQITKSKKSSRDIKIKIESVIRLFILLIDCLD